MTLHSVWFNIYFLTALVCLWCIIHLIHPELTFAAASLAVCPLLTMRLCDCVCVCLTVQCGEGVMPGCSRRLLSWEGEAGGCSGSLWRWPWGVRVSPRRRTPPPLPPPPHTPLSWTTPRKKWTSRASSRARARSKKVCYTCTAMGGASQMPARYGFLHHLSGHACGAALYCAVTYLII